MKAVLVLSFLIFLNACSEPAEFNDFESLGVASERELLKMTLNDIQARLKKFGSNIDVSSTEYKISDGIPVNHAIGACFKNQGIIIEKSIFKGANADAIDWMLWTTLLHEIGHCFFDLQHYDNIIEAPAGTVFAYPNFVWGQDAENVQYASFISSSINASVMQEYARISYLYNLKNDDEIVEIKRDTYVLDVLGLLSKVNPYEDLVDLNKVYLTDIEELFSNIEMWYLCEHPCHRDDSKPTDSYYYMNWFRYGAYEDILVPGGI